MHAEISKLSDCLAQSVTISDYDFWRAWKWLNDELYRLDRQQRPIPIDLIFARAIIRQARKARLQAAPY